MPNETSPAEAPMDKLESSSLRDQALRVIRARIVSGSLLPNQLYALGAVATQLGVSVTPVREAVLELEREGLVELARNRGFRVREMTERDLDEIIELRVMLEVGAVRRIAEGRLLADTAELRRLAAETERRVREGDWIGFLDNDRDFHIGILSHLGNERLIQIVRTLRDQGRLYGLEKAARTERLLESTREHDQLLKAIEDGNPEEAASIMERHLSHARGIWAGRPE
jgi:DNA-binding GntR family transcriptional regulator